MVIFDNEQQKQPLQHPQAETTISQLSKIDELQGKLARQTEEDKLMHSVLENDKKTINEGKLIEEAMNTGVSSFMPDLFFQNLVKNYTLAKQLYGETIIREMTGYDADYVSKNIKIPEFQKVIKKNIKEKARKMQDDGLLDRDYQITDEGIELAMLVMYAEELDHITPKGLQGERLHKKVSHYGDREDERMHHQGDRYRDLAMKKSVKTAIRRGHQMLEEKDLRVFERQSKGQCTIVYAIDASGSMNGRKIGTAKRAGIALAYKAIRNKDKVGLIIFGEDILDVVEPTLDFPLLLKKMVKIRASKRTDIAKVIERSLTLFPSHEGIKGTKHLLVISDALPTSTGSTRKDTEKRNAKDEGKEGRNEEDPQQRTLRAAGLARNKGITISVVGIQLDQRGKELGEKLAEMGKGKFYVVRDLENVDKLILEDYYGVA